MSGKQVDRRDAINENLSTHCEISVIGRYAGAGGRLGACEKSSSIVSSDISTNSRSRMRLTTFRDKEAAGLNRPLAAKGVMDRSFGGVVFVEAKAACASSCRP